jgi:hypothetical protein
MAGLIIIVLFLLVYFIPAIVAGTRDHPQGLAIFALNLFAGWTAIGWVVAIVWACTAVKKPTLPAV